MNYVLHNGPNDYGPRKGTLGLALHMTEGNGGDGDLAYLLRDPARGVSANFFSHSDGTIHQMMPLGHASGSLNPADRASEDKGYYGAKNIKAVLGDKYVNPNAYSISIEIGGKRAKGPNARQIAACIAWGLDMRTRYPSLVGAYGHADQTDTKGCPGTSAAMKSIFTGIGGHGLFVEEDAMKLTDLEVTPGSAAIKTAIGLWPVRTDVQTQPLPVGTSFELGTTATYHQEQNGGKGYRGHLVEYKGEAMVLPASSATFTPSGPSVSYPVLVDVGGQTVSGSVTLP